jgi:serpin B
MRYVAIGVLGCALSTSGSSTPSPVAEVVKGHQTLAFDLYGKLRTEKGNLFFSPYSLSSALAMTYGGARGETERQMAKALHFPLEQNALHEAFGAWRETLAKAAKKGSVEWSVANSIWPDRAYPFRPAYLEMLQKAYGASIAPVDYVHAAEEARGRINRWVEEQTKNKIRDLIGPGILNTLTRMVLVNAVYFKGDWTSPFEAAQTRDAPFYAPGDRTVTAPLMRQKAKFAYGEEDGLQLLEMPYADGALSMLVLLPEARDGLAALEAKLTPEALNTWTARMRRREVEAWFPKFKMTAKFTLNEPLAALGMPDAFRDDKADFSGMTASGRNDGLYITKVLHKAFIEVNEKGTEAAAATAVVVGLRSMPMPPPVFRADRPFWFVIREKSTGSLLFMGRLVDPTAAGE